MRQGGRKIVSVSFVLLFLQVASFGETRYPTEGLFASSSSTSTQSRPRPKRPVVIVLKTERPLHGDFIRADIETDSLVVKIGDTLRTIRLEDVLLIKFVIEDTVSQARASEIELTASQRMAAQEAIKELYKLASATEVGVSFLEYGSRIIDVKAAVDMNLRALPESDVKDEIRLAMEAYADANTAWNRMIRYDFLLPDFEPGKTLMKKYSIPVDTSLGQGILPRRVVLSVIWTAARTHLKRAESLLKH